MTQDKENKELLKKLAAIVENQQKIITRLAQVIPTKMDPAAAQKREADTILKNLPQAARATILQLEIQSTSDGNIVKVRFNPKVDSTSAWNVLQQTVTRLQNANQLTGTSYTIQEVA